MLVVDNIPQSKPHMDSNKLHGMINKNVFIFYFLFSFFFILFSFLFFVLGGRGVL